MSKPNAVADHYTHGNLLAAIAEGVSKIGKSPDTVTIDDLGPVDEFHIGGRQASVHFLDQIAPARDNHVLDVGCGLGGGARFAANRYGAHISGIDLTAEFVETGNALSGWVGLADRITLIQGSALEMPFEAAQFDAAYMMHVGMNIADKGALFGEVARVLKDGATFGVYDVMRTSEGALAYPVPWAATPQTSAVGTPADYRDALNANGFEVTVEFNRCEFAIEFFAQLKARTEAEGPPPLGVHVLMGEDRAQKVQNMVENIGAGRIAPVEMIARKRS